MAFKLTSPLSKMMSQAQKEAGKKFAKKILESINETPSKLKASSESPAKVTGFGAIGQAVRNIKLPKFDPEKFESESEKKARLEREAKIKSTKDSAGKGPDKSSTTFDPKKDPGKDVSTKKQTTNNNQKPKPRLTFAQAYKIRGEQYKDMTLAEYTDEAKKQLENFKKTGKYISKKDSPEIKVSGREVGKVFFGKQTPKTFLTEGSTTTVGAKNVRGKSKTSDTVESTKQKIKDKREEIKNLRKQKKDLKRQDKKDERFQKREERLNNKIKSTSDKLDALMKKLG